MSPTAANAAVAVVVPTRDRPELLRRCLRALSGQTRIPGRVVVVDDGSTAAVEPVAAEFGSRLALSVLRNTVAQGPAAARNRGWQACDEEYVAFTDDDCRPDAGWLAALLAEAAPHRVLVGRTLPDPEDGAPRSVFDRSMQVETCDGGFPTCNVLYPRAVLETVRGFDVTFQLPYGEDTDLGQRALESGAGARYVGAAVVYHALHRRSLGAAIGERRRLPELVRLARRHPQLRTQIWRGRFMNMDHRLLLEGAAGLIALPAAPLGAALVGRRLRGRSAGLAGTAAVGTAFAPLTVAALAPMLRYLYWAERRTHDLPRAGRFRHIAELTLLDAVEVALLAAGSVRHRTLLL